MILAEKIMDLRKKCGWSQEELAEKLGVTRQSVSKWEGAQSTPDLEKLLTMSRLFGVSTDYLLKDEMEPAEPEPADSDTQARRVSLEEASAFLSVKLASAKWIALATFLCIISPIPLLFFGAALDFGRFPAGENAAGGLGLILLLVLVATAVGIFIYTGSKTGRYEYLDKGMIDTEYGVTGLAKEWQSKLQQKRTRFNILGTCLCILSVVPTFAVLAISADEYLMALSICVLLFLVGIGVVLFLLVGIPWESTEKLLQEGDYTRQNKLRRPVKGTVAIIYWLVVVAVFLLIGLRNGNWNIAGVIFPVAGVLFAAVMALTNILLGREKTN